MAHRIVHIDFIPAEIDDHYQIDVEVVGDLAHTLWMLNQRVHAHGPKRLDYDHSRARRAREEMRVDLEEHKDDDTVGSHQAAEGAVGRAAGAGAA